MHRFFRRLILAALPVFLGGFSGAQQPHDQSVQEQKPIKEPDAASIAKLVKQLRSSEFAERAAATKSLEAIGVPALDALRKAAKDNDAEAAQRAARLVEIIENSLDALLADYRSYGLPLPPDDAKLVRFESGGRYILNDKLMPPTYFLGFLLRPGAKDKPALVLVGTQEITIESYKNVEVVKPRIELVRSLELSRWGQATFDMNDGLAVALQCQARGWNALAQELWKSSLKQDCGHHRGTYYQPANLPSRTALAYLVWAFCGNELVKPDADRKKTAKRMKAVLAAEPKLNTRYSQNLMTSLEAALVPSTAKLGTVERMIDDLTDMCNTKRRYDDPDPRYTQLAEMGFAAIPALLDHLSDERLTRSVRQGFNNFPPVNIRVEEIVSDLLQELAGKDLGKDWLRRQQGWGVEKADAQAWWEKARKEGQEAYFLRNVLPADKTSTWPNRLMLSVITKKYPQHLPKLYRSVLDERPNMQSWEIAEAVAKSSLSDDKKRELFLDAANRKNLTHRRVGLTYLQERDPQQFITILLATLESLPKTPTEPYWLCPEAYYAQLVAATEEPKAWKMLETVAQRSDVGLRMEFLNQMHNGYVGEGNRQQRLDFLAAFLDDAEAPDIAANPKMFDGPHAGFTFRRLEVRDLVAMTIASILGMPDSPDRDWTPEQWKKLRIQVKEKLRK